MGFFVISVCFCLRNTQNNFISFINYLKRCSTGKHSIINSCNLSFNLSIKLLSKSYSYYSKSVCRFLKTIIFDLYLFLIEFSVLFLFFNIGDINAKFLLSVVNEKNCVLFVLFRNK